MAQRHNEATGWLHRDKHVLLVKSIDLFRVNFFYAEVNDSVLKLDGNLTLHCNEIFNITSFQDFAWRRRKKIVQFL